MKQFIIIIIALILIYCTFISIPLYINNTEKCMILPWPVETKLGLPWKKPPCGSYKGLMWGDSIIERIGNFKKQIDENGFYFLYRK